MSERERKPVVKVMPATKARIHFGEVLKRVHSGREHIIVEKDGLEVAAILSRADYEHYRRLLALQQLELNRAVSLEMQAKGITEEQALADLKATKNQIFEEYYGHAIKSRRRKAA